MHPSESAEPSSSLLLLLLPLSPSLQPHSAAAPVGGSESAVVVCCSGAEMERMESRRVSRSFIVLLQALETSSSSLS